MDANAALIPLTEEQITRWHSRIEKARTRQQMLHKWWDECRKDYVPKFDESPEKYHTRVRTNRNFKNVHRKAAELVYQRPELTIEPSPLLDDDQNRNMVSTHAEIVNAKIGRNGVDIKKVSHAAACDWLIYGSGGTKCGYDHYTVELEQPVIDPLTQLPVVGPDGKPQTQKIPVPIPGASTCFIEHITPKSWLIPADWRSTDFDRAPWLAHQFSKPMAEIKRRWGAQLPHDWRPSPVKFETLHFNDGLGNEEAKDYGTGVEIWYYSHLERPDRPHPQHMTVLVFLDGLDTPVEHRDSPYQDIDKRGALTPNSLIGNPIHPFLVRMMTDSAYVQSDVAIALPLTHELDTFREQLARQREATLLKWFYDKTKLTPAELADALGASIGGAIGLSPDALTDPQGPFRPMQQSPIPQDNYRENDLIDNDLAQTSGIDSATSGVASLGSQTATESSIVSQNVGVRMGWEQGVFTDCLLSLLTKYATLLARYLDPEDAAHVVGMERANQWKQWIGALKVRLAFSMVPDSSLRNDTPLDRKQWQDLFTYVAQDPNINRAYFLQRLLMKYHVDVSRALMPQPAQPPQPQIEPPKVTLDLKDFAEPQAPVAAAVAEHFGLKIPPEALKLTGALIEYANFLEAKQAQDKALAEPGGAAQPEHGGKVPQLESLDKHQSDKTFGMQNTGDLTPQGPTTLVQ